MSPPVLCFVGPSNGGKTVVIEALLRLLSSWGYRVAAVKHAAHGFAMDSEETDTGRMWSAGAQRVAAVSEGRWAMVERCAETSSLERVAWEVGAGCDLVLAEGFRGSDLPKVLVAASEPGPDWEWPTGVIAAVADVPIHGVLWQCRRDETERLARFVTGWLAAEAPLGPEPAVALLIDGRPVPLNRFATRLFSGALLGMLRGFRGVPEEPLEVRLEVRLPRPGSPPVAP